MSHTCKHERYGNWAHCLECRSSGQVIIRPSCLSNTHKYHLSELVMNIFPKPLLRSVLSSTYCPTLVHGRFHSVWQCCRVHCTLLNYACANPRYKLVLPACTCHLDKDNKCQVYDGGVIFATMPESEEIVSWHLCVKLLKIHIDFSIRGERKVVSACDGLLRPGEPTPSLPPLG